MYESNTTLAQIATALDSAARVLVTAHAKPDGDAFGAIVALAHALELKGKRVERWVMPPLPVNLQAINRSDADVFVHGSDSDPWPTGEPDAIVILDTGSWSQLMPMRQWLEPRRDRITVIDHHLHGDSIAARQYVDHKAAATCEIVGDLIDAMDGEWDRTIAKALYVGLASDTGWFRFSNTTPRVHEMAARLLRAGVDHAGLFHRLEYSERPEKLQLMARALGSLEILADGKAAMLSLTADDFRETGARPEETERIIDLPQVVGPIRVAALLTEMEPDLTRLSFRTKPGPHAIDANQLAKRFGGGGHARAAGAKAKGHIADVRRQVAQAMCEVLEEHLG